MAILQPNWLQTGSYSAKKDRRVMSATVIQEGIVRKGHFAMSQRAAGANMSVDVAAGEAWVKGDSAIDQGYYHVVNDATVNVPVSAANATNPRIDALVLSVNDSTEIGGSDSYMLEVIAGTAQAGATFANLKGAPGSGKGTSPPAIGPTKLLIGYIGVLAGATTLPTAQFGGLKDPNTFNQLWGIPSSQNIEPYAIAGAPPQYAYGRPLEYVPAARVALLSTGLAGSINTVPVWTTGNVEFDPESMQPASGTVMTVKTPGIWLLQGGFSITETRALILTLQKNGANIPGSVAAANGAGQATGLNASIPCRCAYGDTINMIITNGGTAATINGLDFTAVWQGP